MRKRLLVVEDEARVLMMIKERLEFAGYDVTTATEGQDGLKKARAEKPDLIVLDLILPNLNGYQVCAMLKGDKQCQNIPILMLTARSQEKDMAEGMRVGADAYLTKPYDPTVFLDRVAALLRQADERRAEAKLNEDRQESGKAEETLKQAERLGKLLKP